MTYSRDQPPLVRVPIPGDFFDNSLVSLEDPVTRLESITHGFFSVNSP